MKKVFLLFGIIALAAIFVLTACKTDAPEEKTPSSGGTVIVQAKITVTAPATDAIPDTSTPIGSAGYTCGSVTWTPAVADKFLLNTAYTASVTLTAVTGYTFTGGLTAAKTINGQTATVSNNTGASVVLSYTFPATTALIPVAAAAITVSTPEIGQTAATAVPAGGAGYTCSTVTWTPAVSVFTYSTQYTASVTLTADAGYTFAGGLTNKTINGQTATESNNTGNTVTLSYQFPATADPVVIETAAITVNAPATEAAPVTTAPAGGIGYTCGIVTWSPAATGGKFAVNTQYTASVTLTAALGYTFAGGLAVKTINGQPADEANRSDISVTLSDQFAATAPIIVKAAGIAVTYPITGASPVTTAPAGGVNYTCSTVSWTPAVSGTFAAETQYTVSVTLTADSIHTFTGGLSVKTINGWTAIEAGNNGTDVTLSYEFPVTSPVPYIITSNTEGGFDITRNGTPVGTAGSPINTVLGTIRSVTAGAACGIQFGDGITPLNIGTAYAAITGEWGPVTLSGKITGSPSGASQEGAVITIGNGVSPVISVADVTNTSDANNPSLVSILNASGSDGLTTIAGGVISVPNGNSAFVIRNTSISNLLISGGTISGAGRPLQNHANAGSNGGTITISGGTITGAGDFIIYNSSNGTIRISGGTVEGTATGGNCRPVSSNGGGKIYISGTALIKGLDSSGTRGVIQIEGANAGALEMTGGRVENNNTGGGNTIGTTAGAGTTISITGGVVYKAGTSGNALWISGTSGSATALIGSNAVIVGNISAPAGAVTDMRP